MTMSEFHDLNKGCYEADAKHFRLDHWASLFWLLDNGYAAKYGFYFEPLNRIGE